MKATPYLYFKGDREAALRFGVQWAVGCAKRP
jgi:hypothetical protein